MAVLCCLYNLGRAAWMRRLRRFSNAQDELRSRFIFRYSSSSWAGWRRAFGGLEFQIWLFDGEIGRRGRAGIVVLPWGNGHLWKEHERCMGRLSGWLELWNHLGVGSCLLVLSIVDFFIYKLEDLEVLLFLRLYKLHAKPRPNYRCTISKSRSEYAFHGLSSYKNCPCLLSLL